MKSASHVSPKEFIEEDENKDCEGFGCQEKATEQLELAYGKYGSTLFFVCKNCKEKIQNMRGI